MTSDETEEQSEKRSLIASILENSELSEECRQMIVDSLLRIPENHLEQIADLLDRVVEMRSGDRGGAEKISFTCLAKHETEVAELVIRRSGKPAGKPRGCQTCLSPDLDNNTC